MKVIFEQYFICVMFLYCKKKKILRTIKKIQLKDVEKLNTTLFVPKIVQKERFLHLQFKHEEVY